MARKTEKQHAAWRAAEVGTSLPTRGRRRVCAVYPGPYYVAMANLGYQWLMHALVAADFAVARVVWPEGELLAEATTDTLRAIDDDRPARGADIWFVSVSFENDLPHLAGLLRLAGLSPFAAERRDGDPLIVAGGVVPNLNPEPASALADVCLLGEGAAALDPFLAYLDTHDLAAQEDFLRGLAALPHAYVGRYYEPAYLPDGRLDCIRPLAGFPARVVAPKEKQIDPALNRTHLRAPQAAFGDALLIETARGCTQRCRFCAAGHLYLPYRSAPPPAETPDLAHDAVGLVGSNISGHGNRKPLASE